jgi:hypothetical protein
MMSHPTLGMIDLISPLQATGNVGDAFSSAFTTFLTQIFAFIPNLIGALVTLVVGYVIIKVAVKGLGIGMKKSNVDEHLGRTEVGQFIERSGQTFSGLTTSIVRGLLWLIVAVYAITVLGIAPLTTSMLSILAWLPDLVGAGIIVFAGVLIASYAGKAISNALSRYGVGGGTIVGLAVKLLIYALVINFALIQLGFGQGILYTTSTALSWGLAAAIAMGLGIPIAYSLKEVMPPMFTGATTVASTLKEGQQVSIEGIPNTGYDGGKISGTIRAVGMFNTIIERPSNGRAGGFVILPNKQLMDRPIFVEGGEAPTPWEHGIRKNVTSFEAQQRVASGDGEATSRHSQALEEKQDDLTISH